MFKRRNLFGVILAPFAIKAVEHESAAPFIPMIRGELLETKFESPNISRSIIKYKKILQVQENINDKEEIKYKYERFGVTYIVDQGGTYDANLCISV